MEDDAAHPVLYKCPYCVEGRFRDRAGWQEAIQHIKTKHMNGHRRKNREVRGERDEEMGNRVEGLLFDETAQ